MTRTVIAQRRIGHHVASRIEVQRPVVIQVVENHLKGAAVCHGAQLLAAADVIRGKKISAYPACAPEVRLAGGEYADIAVDAAVTDGNFITAPAWPAHPQWLAQFLARLGTTINL